MRGLALLLLSTLLFASGCSSDCQRLCTAWYDYQRDVCGLVNLDDDRVTCISDYRASQTSDEELGACSELIDEVTALRSANDDSCCTAAVGECPLDGGDDDSSR